MVVNRVRHTVLVSAKRMIYVLKSIKAIKKRLEDWPSIYLPALRK